MKITIVIMFLLSMSTATLASPYRSDGCPKIYVLSECTAFENEIKKYVVQGCFDNIYDTNPKRFGGLTKLQAREKINILMPDTIEILINSILPLLEMQPQEIRMAVYKAYRDYCFNQYADNLWRFNESR